MYFIMKGNSVSFFYDHADNFFSLSEKLRLVYTIAKGY